MNNNYKKNIVGKSTIDSVLKFMEKPMFKNLPKQNEEYPLLIPENPAHKTNKTIEELKEIVEQQIINAEKQDKNNKFLTKLTIFITIVGLLIPVVTLFLPNQQESFLSKELLQVSKDNFENQVKISKLERELLKAKKTFEKEKKLP